MKFIEEKDTSEIKPCAATIGCFDGVHQGHRFLISQVCREARKEHLKSAIISFPIHPRQIMQSDYRPQLLSCIEQKAELISCIEGDYCILLPFTKELSKLTARQFMQLLYDKCNVRALVIGYDHRFGHNRAETFDDYCRYGKGIGIKVIKAEPLKDEDSGNFISSSAIRKLLMDGNVTAANRFLGYRYYIDGTVKGGHRIGRTIGFPTANIEPSCQDKLVPASGVYAVKTYIDGNSYRGMLNIGYRPTINNGTNISIEVHIIGFDSDIYNHRIRIEFMERIRPEIKFNSLEELTRQLGKDKIIISKIED